MMQWKPRISVLAAALIWPGVAIAHPGHELSEPGAVSSAAHALIGIDDPTALLLVALWSGMVGLRIAIAIRDVRSRRASRRGSLVAR